MADVDNSTSGSKGKDKKSPQAKPVDDPYSDISEVDKASTSKSQPVPNNGQGAAKDNKKSSKSADKVDQDKGKSRGDQRKKSKSKSRARSSSYSSDR